MTEGLESGTCPVCGTREVYSDRKNAGRSKRETMVVSGHGFYLDTYICLACGYYEERLPRAAVEGVAERIRKEWEKVS